MRKRNWAIVIALSLSACGHATTGPVRTVSDYCLIARGISYASQLPGLTETSANLYDTAATVAAIEAHNLAYDRVCHPTN